MSRSETSTRTATPAPPRRFGLVHVAAVALAGGLGIAMWLWAPLSGSGEPIAPLGPAVAPTLSMSNSAGTTADGANPAANSANGAATGSKANSAPESEDDRRRKLILGEWTQLKDGKRHFTIREDGTGLMVVEPDTMYALVVGKRIEIDITWKVENGLAIFDSVSGRPQKSYEWVRQFMGTHRDRRIVEMTEDRVLLHDDEDDSQTEWTRVKAAK